MKIFLDVDGILADFTGMAMSFYEVKEDLGFVRGSWDSVPLIAKHKGMSVSDFWNGLTTEFWSEMPWTADGRNILEFCYTQTENVCLLTSPANALGGHGRMKWIEKNLPSMWKNKEFCLCSNKFYLAHPDVLLIDDYDKNVNEFKKHKGNAYLYPRYWNSKNSISGMKHILDIRKEATLGWMEYTETIPKIISDTNRNLCTMCGK